MHTYIHSDYGVHRWRDENLFPRGWSLERDHEAARRRAGSILLRRDHWVYYTLNATANVRFHGETLREIFLSSGENLSNN